MSAVLPITEDDAFIQAALQSAEIPALLLALAQATGDLSILREDLRPDASTCDARAYLGLTIPGFPNLFCLYGPNTNIVVNGSIIFFSECSITYVMDSIRRLLADKRRTMECREDVFWAYNREIDDANQNMAWGASDVHSWYKNELGRVSQNWPYTLREYWQRTQQVTPSDFVFG